MYHQDSVLYKDLESIFKAGVWVGVLIVVAIIGLIVWLISKFTRRG